MGAYHFKEARKAAKVSQMEMAEQLGKAVHTIRHYEDAENADTLIEMAQTYSKRFGVPAAYLLGVEDDRACGEDIGLSAAAIDAVKDIDAEKLSALNDLLASDRLPGLLGLICELRDRADLLRQYVDGNIPISVPAPTSSYLDNARYSQYLISEEMSAILDDLYSVSLISDHFRTLFSDRYGKKPKPRRSTRQKAESRRSIK